MQKGRKKKVRYIQKMPNIVYFSPRGKAGRPEELELRVDQFEALRLSDYQGYNQAEGAKHMGISRPSFGRILNEGRKIIAEVISTGKILKIRIGDVQVGVRQSILPKKKEIVRESQQIEESSRLNLLKSAHRTPQKSSK